MKTIQISNFLMLIFSLQIAYGQSPGYHSAMQEAIEKVMQGEEEIDFREAANTFDRINQKEPEQWLPLYYGAYANVMLQANLGDNMEKDRLLDLAKEKIDQAQLISQNNSELLAMQGFITMLRIPIDPATRGPQLSGSAMAVMQQAISLNPENPRAHMFLADMKFGMAQFFGNDNSEGCVSLKKALSLYESF